MKYKVSKDMSIITTIPEANIDKLFEKMEWCICNSIEETLLNSEKISEINIGIGYLYILTEEGNIKYKFVPSKHLEDNIKATYNNGKNPLTLNIEDSLIKKITNVYKELL